MQHGHWPSSRQDIEKRKADLDTAQGINPLDWPGLLHRSVLRSSCPDAKYRDAKKAREDAQRLCEMGQWKYGNAIAALAAACAEAGDFAEAVKFQKRALADAEYAAADNGEGRTRLKLYEEKKPYRLPVK